MRAAISVVIPTLNAAHALPDTLAALFEGVQAGLIREVILSDGGSQDDTVALAEAVGAVLLTGPASRGGQLRRGCAAAQGEWLLVVHADTQLAPGWSKAVQEHLTRQETGYFALSFRARGCAPALVAGWANLRARLFGLPYGDQGLLIRRATYDEIGGYPDQPLMEDVALVRALPRRPVALPAKALTSAERYRRDGWLRRGARNLALLLAYFLGADPHRLAERYRS